MMKAVVALCSRMWSFRYRAWSFVIGTLAAYVVVSSVAAADPTSELEEALDEIAVTVRSGGLKDVLERVLLSKEFAAVQAQWQESPEKREKLERTFRSSMRARMLLTLERIKRDAPQFYQRDGMTVAVLPVRPAIRSTVAVECVLENGIWRLPDRSNLNSRELQERIDSGKIAGWEAEQARSQTDADAVPQSAAGKP